MARFRLETVLLHWIGCKFKVGPLRFGMIIGGLALSLPRHLLNINCLAVRKAVFRVNRFIIRTSRQIAPEIARRTDQGQIIINRAIAHWSSEITSELARMTPLGQGAETAPRNLCHPELAGI